MIEHLEGDPAMTILAIDLGKGKSVFCDFDTLTGKVRFGKVATTGGACGG